MSVVDLSTAAELQRRMEEETRARGRARDDLAAAMFRELRAPLNDLLSATSALLDGMRGPLSDLQATSVRTIDSRTRRLLTTISDFADYSDAISGGLHPRHETVPLAQACEAALHEAESAAEAKQISLELHLHDRETVFQADEAQSQKMLSRLVRHAVDLAPHGGRVVVSAWPAGATVCFAVEHSGAGMTEEELSSLFEPSARRRHAEGVGIGLALAKRLAELHGGTLGIESEPERGTRLTLTLPMSRAATR